MSITKDQIIEAVASMSVMEVVELITAMEEKFGVSAAAAVAAGPAAVEAVEEQTEFNVILTAAGANGTGKPCNVLRRGAVHIQFSTLAEDFDAQLRSVKLQGYFPAIGHPALTLLWICQALKREVQTGFSRKLRLGMLAIPGTLTTLQLHPSGQATEHHAQHGQHPEH